MFPFNKRTKIFGNERKKIDVNQLKLTFFDFKVDLRLVILLRRCAMPFTGPAVERRRAVDEETHEHDQTYLRRQQQQQPVEHGSPLRWRVGSQITFETIVDRTAFYLPVTVGTFS